MARGRRPRRRSYGSQNRRAVRASQGRSRRRRWPKASLDEPAPLGDPGAASIVGGSPRSGKDRRHVLISSIGQARSEASLQSDPRLVPSSSGRSRPASSYPAEREAPDHYALSVSDGSEWDQGDRSNLDGGVSSHSPARRTVTLERFERGVGRSPPDLKSLQHLSGRPDREDARP